MKVDIVQHKRRFLSIANKQVSGWVFNFSLNNQFLQSLFKLSIHFTCLLMNRICIITIMQKLNVQLSDKMASLKDNLYFSGLDDLIQARIAQHTQLYNFSMNEAVCWQGDECLGLYIIHKGSVKLFKLSPRGRELIINILTDRATFNEVPVFDNGSNVVNVSAMEDSQIWLVEKQVIRQILAENPDFARLVILKLSQNMRRMISLIEDLSLHQVTNRLARLISRLPAEQLQGQTSQRMTQDLLAARLGTVREVVARSLRELEHSGAIRVSRRQIIITDANKLDDWASGIL